MSRSRRRVRISFGGESGSELAVTCTSVSQLQAAYQQVISAYDVNKIDFDIECPGGAQSYAQPTCSSIVQTPDQFMDTLGAY
jgi:hypothetical protein